MTETKYDAFLQWEYTLSGRSTTVWAAASWSLIRGADLLWSRTEAASKLWEDGFTVDERGLPKATGRRLVGEEIEIFGDLEVSRSAILLLGLGIESLAKSVLIARDPTLIGDAGEFSRSLTHHNLLALVEQCGLKVSEEQRDCMTALRDYTEWLGRYPVPKSFTGGRSVAGAWVWHRMEPRTRIWAACRPIATELERRRDG